ncbi:remorin family protein, partial [Tanacetum coccineum]
MALVVKETPVTEVKKARSSLDRDVALAEVDKEKKLSFIKAWEETEKSKVENKAQKELSAITAWENTKRADIEAKLKQIE